MALGGWRKGLLFPIEGEKKLQMNKKKKKHPPKKKKKHPTLSVREVVKEKKAH